MTDYGTAQSPSTNLYGITFAPGDRIYCPVGWNVNLVSCVSYSGTPYTGATVTGDAEVVSFTPGATWSAIIKTKSTSQIQLTFNMQVGGTVSVTLIGTSVSPTTIQDSGGCVYEFSKSGRTGDIHVYKYGSGSRTATLRSYQIPQAWLDSVDSITLRISAEKQSSGGSYISSIGSGALEDLPAKITEVHILFDPFNNYSFGLTSIATDSLTGSGILRYTGGITTTNSTQNAVYGTSNGVLYYLEYYRLGFFYTRRGSLFKYPAAAPDTGFTIPARIYGDTSDVSHSILGISPDAFSGVRYLKDLRFSWLSNGESFVTYIEERAFKDSSVNLSKIPRGVMTVKSQAFANTPITEVTLPSTLSTVGTYLFGIEGVTGYTLTLEKVTIERDIDLSDTGDVFFGDYSAMVSSGKFVPGVYERRISNGGIVWESIAQFPDPATNTASFVISLDVGGGMWDDPLPKAQITAAYDTDGNAVQFDNTISSFVPTVTDTEEIVLVWYSDNANATRIEVSLTDMPYVRSSSDMSGMRPPVGFDSMTSWEAMVPYYKLTTPSSGAFDTTYEMKRPSTEHIRHVVMRPFWVPARDGHLRCLTVTPGLGSVDFGTIQGISETYNASITSIPIVCYGYTGAFCMDLGVTRTVTVSYIRVSPNNPDNDSYDSRDWDNATWIRRFKDLTDRWQMRTNGSVLYIKRPNLERSDNGMPDGSPPADDPMKSYMTEIEGQNCYISSGPVRYTDGNPYKIASSVTFRIGTLYPKQPAYLTTKVTYVWEGVEGRSFTVTYPSNISVALPMFPGTWLPIINGNTVTYASQWQRVIGGSSSGNPKDPKEFFTTTPASSEPGVMTFRVKTETYTDATWALIPYAHDGDTYTVSGGTTIILVAMGGGGGGGLGAGSSDGPYSYGGGAGASGVCKQVSQTYSDGFCTVRGTIGAGGNGGTWPSGPQPTDGTGGGATTVYVNDIPRLYVTGGAPGKNHAYGYGDGAGGSGDGIYNFSGGSGGMRDPGHIRDSTDGSCPTGQTNYGKAGLCFSQGSSSRFYCFGGGGGGGPVIFDTPTDYFGGTPPKGGDGGGDDGTTYTDPQPGVYGGGGGGGRGGGGSSAYIPGGKGGDGFLLVIAPGATIYDSDGNIVSGVQS